MTVDGVERAALQAFMSRVRVILGHDLRTPLATIVNYAYVLENTSGLDESLRRDLPRRIRDQALQTAEMLRQLLDATLLAASAPAFTTVDPRVLLQSIVAEFDSGASLSERTSPPARAVAPASGPFAVELEAEVVSFAWRAFLRLEQSVPSHPLSAARATVAHDANGVRLDLTLGEAGGGSEATVDLDTFFGGGEVALPASLRFALQLSRDLVAARGGALELCGRVGSNAVIRLGFGKAN